MPLHRDDSGRREVAVEVLVPGTPEQVWHAIATGPGMGAWFTTTSVEEHVGGAINFDFGGENCGTDVSRGKVTAWDPPHRFAYEEYDWSGDAPPLATEVTVTSRSGDRCVIRMVHSLFTDRDDWDDELESFESGWPGAFEVLKIYLAEFAGLPASTVRVMAVHEGDEAQAWARLTGALNLSGANVGERRESPAEAPRLAGVVERVHQDNRVRDLMMRIDEPAQGIATLGTCTVAGQASAMASIFFYGDEAERVAAAEQDKWSSWLRGLLEAQHTAT
ncbi:SRPBCC family protein [Mycolicibacterium celeriflavum]|uniref:SRPBCC family protein n=1 Tax=Mycolicibacterium celeriflavum TaxID=1249101 RepID=UPI003CE8C32F